MDLKTNGISQMQLLQVAGESFGTSTFKFRAASTGHGFEVGVYPCRLSSGVECFLGKEEVTGSNPVVGSN